MTRLARRVAASSVFVRSTGRLHDAVEGDVFNGDDPHSSSWVSGAGAMSEFDHVTVEVADVGVLSTRRMPASTEQPTSRR